ncbi:VOC family protein [Ferrimonas balearica]|uniref:VOC family protein n=1 Tax=Ferrimonas balearica TaxID=44012 RepID=UPI001C9A0814|nr:VOC family protein [Ferrimonas balearica]MBY5922551.1 VOC family protein [Ferrimonas balearica]MBY5995535.1 VOC family protein [Ferrimonas balearica]
MSDFNTRHNRAVWFDIPVSDLSRARAFYEGVLGLPVYLEQAGEFQFAVLAHQQGNGGCLVPTDAPIGSDTGVLIYLNVAGRLQAAVAQVTALGGELLQPIHPLGPHGYRALIRDSEGNRLALHAPEAT